MKAEKIKKDIYWVGALDYNIRDFHGYVTPEGSTYNSYLIVDDKTVLIDTVKSPFKEELLNRIGSVMNVDSIDYLVINHVEMDHSSSATSVMELNPDAEVICSEKGKEFLNSHYQASSEWNIRTVSPDDTLSIGTRKLSFIPATMLHWPDTMFTYSASDKILFSNDGFGQHIATPNRFSDQNPGRDIYGSAKTYYANILMPFSSIANKKLTELGGLSVDVICPSHGVIFNNENDIKKIINLYTSWSAGDSVQKAVIVYDTMYRSTEKMARSIEDALLSGGVQTRIFNLRVSDLSQIMSEILDARAVVVGSSTLNNGPLPSVGAFLTYLKGLRPRGKIGASFGSYGWGGGAVKTISEDLKASGLILPEDGFQKKFVPYTEVLKQAFEFGLKLSEKIKEEQ